MHRLRDGLLNALFRVFDPEKCCVVIYIAFNTVRVVRKVHTARDALIHNTIVGYLTVLSILFNPILHPILYSLDRIQVW